MIPGGDNRSNDDCSPEECRDKKGSGKSIPERPGFQFPESNRNEGGRKEAGNDEQPNDHATNDNRIETESKIEKQNSRRNKGAVDDRGERL